MSAENPFETPAADPTPKQRAPVEDLTELILPLRETRPWVRFLAIMGFLGAGFTVLAGLGLLFMGRLEGMPSGVPVRLMGLLYLALAGLYVAPSVFLNQYADAIVNVERGGGLPWLATALQRQRSFWRFAGVLTLILVCLTALAFCGGMIAGMANR